MGWKFSSVFDIPTSGQAGKPASHVEQAFLPAIHASETLALLSPIPFQTLENPRGSNGHLFMNLYTDTFSQESSEPWKRMGTGWGGF